MKYFLMGFLLGVVSVFGSDLTSQEKAVKSQVYTGWTVTAGPHPGSVAAVAAKPKMPEVQPVSDALPQPAKKTLIKPCLPIAALPINMGLHRVQRAFVRPNQYFPLPTQPNSTVNDKRPLPGARFLGKLPPQGSHSNSTQGVNAQSSSVVLKQSFKYTRLSDPVNPPKTIVLPHFPECGRVQLDLQSIIIHTDGANSLEMTCIQSGDIIVISLREVLPNAVPFGLITINRSQP